MLAGRGRRAAPGTVPGPEAAPRRGTALPCAPATGTGTSAAFVAAAITPVIAPVIAPVIKSGAGPALTARVLPWSAGTPVGALIRALGPGGPVSRASAASSGAAGTGTVGSVTRERTAPRGGAPQLGATGIAAPVAPSGALIARAAPPCTAVGRSAVLTAASFAGAVRAKARAVRIAATGRRGTGIPAGTRSTPALVGAAPVGTALSITGAIAAPGGDAEPVA
ncbi:MAG: hypothetical protein AVDCRST_MAG83-2235 [uncultured Arthrobacter sp.]|uniref:Uncharacterized protein n=1 Tax=uncultured Arthrobacter sp. TaxID=114050 RepID=A0A6J4IKC0_9MICC|nr:hypothetical protein [uncultured Arthrobacter sp.]CAA9252792.1 MAG: hypothetical protein AVDCRST_MAG83-2235 [uncultured Arthrobacter sp.]